MIRLEKSGNFTHNPGKSGNFDTGKLGEKYWKSQVIYQLGKVKTMEIWCHTLKKETLEKITGKMKKIKEKSRVEEIC